MNIPNWKRITKSDHQDMPEWFEAIIDLINQQIDILTIMAQGNISASENFFGEVRTLEMPPDTYVPIEMMKLKRNPIGVVYLSSDYEEYPELPVWKMNGEKARTVDVKIKWAVVPATVPMVTFLFLGG